MNFILTDLLEKIFPRHCICCGTPGRSLCFTCAQKLPLGSTLFPDVFSLLSYKNGMVKKLLHRLKYQSDLSVYDSLLQLHERELAKRLSSLDTVMIVPIPMRQSRKRTRRIDHVLYIAEKIGLRLNIPVVPILKWKIETKGQVEQRKRDTRLKNIVGALSIDTSIPITKTIVLIDDIMTTGATLKEAQRVLKEKGATRIISSVLAH